MTADAGENRLGKQGLRRRLRALREALGADVRTRADANIQRRVCESQEFGACELLLTYLDVGTEVRTRDVIRAAWAANKTVALPWCVPGSRRMRWFCVSDLNELVRGAFGTWEPVPHAKTEVDPASCARSLALVPGLAFDVRGYRLGYGGGFYDTFLCDFAGVSMGLCRDEQLCDDLFAAGAVEPHDLPADVVVTQSRLIVGAAAD